MKACLCFGRRDHYNGSLLISIASGGSTPAPFPNVLLISNGNSVDSTNIAVPSPSASPPQ